MIRIYDSESDAQLVGEKAKPEFSLECGYGDYYSLYLPCDGENNSTIFTDIGPHALGIAASGSAVISTAQSVSGGSSLYLNGSGWLSIPYNAVLNFGNYDPERTGTEGDFLINFKVRFTSVANQNLLGGNYNNNGLLLQLWNGLAYIYPGGNGGPSYTYSWSPSINTWYDLKWKRAGSTMQLLIDDVSRISQTYTGNVTVYSGGNLEIGHDQTNAAPAYAYIDELIILKGVSAP